MQYQVLYGIHCFLNVFFCVLLKKIKIMQISNENILSWVTWVHVMQTYPCFVQYV